MLQSTGVTGGTWPGYVLNGNSKSSVDCYGDISEYNNTTRTLYNNIKSCENSENGLYLVSNAKAGTTTAGQGSGYYWSALKTAATNYSSFGVDHDYAWLGTVWIDCAWAVDKNGGVWTGFEQTYSFVIAPAFSIDASKISVDADNNITIK